MKEHRFIRMKIGKTHSGKDLWMCMEENRIDEWVRTQMIDFDIRDFVDALCAFKFLSTKEIKHDFDLRCLSATHSNSVMAERGQKIMNLMKTLKIISEKDILDHGSNYIIIEPSEF